MHDTVHDRSRDVVVVTQGSVVVNTCLKEGRKAQKI